MFAQLPTPLPCETMKDTTTSCNQPARIGILNVMETITDTRYILTPICTACIAALATAAGQVPAVESFSAETVKQALATRLGLEGAEETLAALREIGTADGADPDD